LQQRIGKEREEKWRGKGNGNGKRGRKGRSMHRNNEKLVPKTKSAT